MTFKQWLLIALFIQGVFVTGVNASEAPAKNALPEVIFETTAGPITLELYAEKAPETVANFLTYLDQGFYTNTLFHRAIPGFVIQGGGFEKGMKIKPTRAPIKNESANRVKNTRGTISMARRTHPDTATSQFYINLAHNSSLDWKAEYQPGYTVFGKVTGGMDVVDKISRVETNTQGHFQNVPKEDTFILLAKRKGAAAKSQEPFIAGEHYTVLDKPVPTRDRKKIEVVEMFSYGCPHCYEFEPLVKQWSKQQANDVDFWYFPAVWNKPMALYARAFYTARALNIAEKIHHPLFTTIVIEQKKIGDENDLANFFTRYGIDRETFAQVFHSTAVTTQTQQAEQRVRIYKPAGVPEVVVNGKYRIDRMRAGGQTEMLAVMDFLIDKERTLLKK